MILEIIDIHCNVLIFISSFINLGLFSIVLVNLAKSLSILFIFPNEPAFVLLTLCGFCFCFVNLCPGFDYYFSSQLFGVYFVFPRP